MRVSGPDGVTVLWPGLRLAHMLRPLVLRPGLGLARLLLVSAAGLLHLLAAAMLLGALSVLSTPTTAARLSALRMLVATVATLLLGASGMASLVVLGLSPLVLVVAATMRGRRRRGSNRQSGYTCGQEKPGHDKKLPSFQSFNEDVGWRVPAAKFTSSAMKRILAQ